MRTLDQAEIAALKIAASHTKNDVSEPQKRATISDELLAAINVASSNHAVQVVEEDDLRMRIQVTQGDTGWFIETDPTIAIVFEVHRFKRYWY